MGKHMKQVLGPEFNGIDFSPLHHVMMLDDDGVTKRPMDTNYFETWERQPGIWQILTHGDYQYLVEGADYALVIDTGWGIGNLKKMCETLTDKPIIGCFITHEHGDHIGGCSYFDKVFLSKTCHDIIMDPEYMKGFGGGMYKDINYPLDFNCEIIGDGYKFDLGGGVVLETMEIPDHAPGSIALLDLYHRCIFTGDEIVGTPAYKEVRTTVEQYSRNVDRLFAYLDDVDMLYGGGFVEDHMLLYRQKQALDRIKAGYPGVPFTPPAKLELPAPENPPVKDRRLPPQPFMINRMSIDADKKLQFTYSYFTCIYYKDKIFD